MSTNRILPSVVQYASKLRSCGDQAMQRASSGPMSPLNTSAPCITFHTLSLWSEAQHAISCSLVGLQHMQVIFLSPTVSTLSTRLVFLEDTYTARVDAKANRVADVADMY